MRFSLGPSLLREKYTFPSVSALRDARKASAFAFSSVEVLDRDNTDKPSDRDLIALAFVNWQNARESVVHEIGGKEYAEN